MVAEPRIIPPVDQTASPTNRQPTSDDAIRGIFKEYYANEIYVLVVARSLKDKISDMLGLW